VRRREFITLLALSPALRPISLHAGPPSPESPPGTPADSLIATARRLRTGELTAVDYASRFLERAAGLRWLNAFITLDPAQLLGEARRADERRRRERRLPPLHGVPLAVKDNIETAALPTTAGTPGLEGFRPARDATAVVRCRAAGALLAGKTNLHELAFGGTSNNGYFGAVQNPRARGFVPGGSSGGSAAVVAAGLLPAALGTDTLGSLRMPASLCGVVGFRPTPGRYPAAGIIPLAPTLDTVGPLAANVADIAWLDDVLRGAAPLRLEPAPAGAARAGLLSEAFEGLDPATAQVIDALRPQLRTPGADAVAVSARELFDSAPGIVTTLLAWEMIKGMRAWLAALPEPVPLEQLVARIYREEIRGFWAEQLAHHDALRADYQRVMAVELPRFRAGVARLFEAAGIETLAYPTTPLPARRIRENDAVEFNGSMQPASLAYSRNTLFASLAGLPCISVPAGSTADGLPVGIELAGRPGTDRGLLRIAAGLEALRGSL
jgi:mandelamide amidase